MRSYPPASCSAWINTSILPWKRATRPLTSDGDAIYLKSADGQNAYETLFIYQGEATEYTVRDGVKIIADNVFNGNYDLEKVTIPGTVTSIGSYAFAEGYLSELYFEAGGTETLTIGDYAFYYSRIATMHLPTDRDVVIGDYAFAEISGSSYLTDVDLGGTTEIGDYAFAGSGNYSSFTIPASVKSIGNYAFEGGYSSRAVTFTFAGDSVARNDRRVRIYGKEDRIHHHPRKRYEHRRIRLRRLRRPHLYHL